VVKVLSTHHHYDHSQANPELAAHFKAPVLGHASDADRLPGFTEGLSEGNRVAIGRLEAEVVFIPAHTRGHIAYVFPGAVFCGDTLFAGGCGRLFEGTPAMMHEALNVKLARLPDDTRVFCGHEYTQKNLEFAVSLEPGNKAATKKLDEVRALRKAGKPTIPSTIAEEKATNPFLRTDSAELAATVRGKVPGIPANDPIALFAAVRALKDRF